MSDQFEVSAKIRKDVGKGASRRLRHEGLIPAVVYGAGKDAQSLTLEHHKIIKSLENILYYILLFLYKYTLISITNLFPDNSDIFIFLMHDLLFLHCLVINLLRSLIPMFGYLCCEIYFFNFD